MKTRFGPAGNSERFYEEGYKRSHEQPKWLHSLGLDAYEYSFGRGVRLSDKTANEIGEEVEKYGIALSVHAPYFINLASQRENGMENNIRYFQETAHTAVELGAKRIIFHPASLGSFEREEAVALAKKNLEQVLECFEQERYSHLLLCPETMGKINQIGDLEETIEFCKLSKKLVPCIDFGHLYARSLGEIEGDSAMEEVFDKLIAGLGKERIQKMHIHFSRIEYTDGGERRHWNYEDTEFGPDFTPLAKQLIKREITPIIICESRGNQADDAATFKSIYENLKEAQNNDNHESY